MKLIYLFLLSLVVMGPIGSPSARAEFNIGDKKQFWVWDLNIMPPGARQITAEAQACGTHFCIFVETPLWGTQLNSSILNQFYQALEFRASDYAFLPNMGIVSLSEKIFGGLPKSVQGPEQLIILFADLGKYKNYEFDGFFNVFDRLTEAEAWKKYQQHSNELNVIYLNGLRKNETYTLGVISHELHHLLSPNEKDLWYSEMIAEGAMLLNGYYTDQGHVNRYMQETGSFPLVGQSYVQYGPQILFSAFLIDTFGGYGALDELSSDSEINGRHAIEQLYQRKFSTPSSFDAIFSNFIGYIFNAAERSQRLPYAVSKHNQVAGLSLQPIKRAGKIPLAPGFIQGSVDPYGFSVYDLDEPLAANSDVALSLLGPAPCADGRVLWKPLSTKSLAVFSVGCEQVQIDDHYRFQLQVISKNTSPVTDPNTSPPEPKEAATNY